MSSVGYRAGFLPTGVEKFSTVLASTSHASSARSQPARNLDDNRRTSSGQIPFIPPPSAQRRQSRTVGCRAGAFLSGGARRVGVVRKRRRKSGDDCQRSTTTLSRCPIDESTSELAGRELGGADNGWTIASPTRRVSAAFRRLFPSSFFILSARPPRCQLFPQRKKQKNQKTKKQ